MDHLNLVGCFNAVRFSSLYTVSVLNTV